MDKQCLERAYRKFLDERESTDLTPWFPLSYDVARAAATVKWHAPFSELMVSGDLQETMNLLNSWRRRLRDWHIWLKVLKDYDDDASWFMRDHFLEPIVFFCMLQPSSTRD